VKSSNDQNAKLAGAEILRNHVRPTTFVLAALIFGVAGLSALWLLVIAGLAGLCSLLIAFIGNAISPQSLGTRAD
jgi:hypothetical protein